MSLSPIYTYFENCIKEELLLALPFATHFLGGLQGYGCRYDVFFKRTWRQVRFSYVYGYAQLLPIVIRSHGVEDFYVLQCTRTLAINTHFTQLTCVSRAARGRFSILPPSCRLSCRFYRQKSSQRSHEISILMRLTLCISLKLNVFGTFLFDQISINGAWAIYRR